MQIDVTLLQVILESLNKDVKLMCNQRKRKLSRESKESIFTIILDIFINISGGIVKVVKNMLT